MKQRSATPEVKFRDITTMFWHEWMRQADWVTKKRCTLLFPGSVTSSCKYDVRPVCDECIIKCIPGVAVYVIKTIKSSYNKINVMDRFV